MTSSSRSRQKLAARSAFCGYRLPCEGHRGGCALVSDAARFARHAPGDAGGSVAFADQGSTGCVGEGLCCIEPSHVLVAADSARGGARLAVGRLQMLNRVADKTAFDP